MKRLLCVVLSLAMLCTVIGTTAFAAEKIEPVLKDDFILEGTPYKQEGLNCIDTLYDTLADNKKVTTWDNKWDAWMLPTTFDTSGYAALEYNMVCAQPGVDGSLTYTGDFGGKVFSTVAIYSEPLVQKFANGDWWEWEPLYENMPVKMYAGVTEENMQELEINYFRHAAWYPEAYLEYFVDELPADTKFVKVVLPGASEEDYQNFKIACVTVTADKSIYADAYVNPYIPFEADDALTVKLQKFFVNGDESDLLANGTVYGKTVISSCRSASINATMFVNLYKDGEIVAVSSDNKTIAGYQNVVFSTEATPLTIPEGEDPASYSIRMWVLTDIGPVGKAVSIEETADVAPVVDSGSFDYDYITVVTPKYTNEISGDTMIRFYAPAFVGYSIELKCWQQDDGIGHDFVAEIPVDENGYGEYLFKADEFPHGPLQIRLEGEIYDEWEDEYIAQAMTNLQVYNIGGVAFQEGLGEYADSLVPDVAKDLKVIFEDDFTDGNLSIARWDSTKTYGSHKLGFGDYSGVFFRDYEDENLNAFSQFDTYLRIRADQNKNSAGILSTAHQDGEGVMAGAPAYFECRMVAPYEKGTWPAIWFMTYDENGGPVDELDLLEAYGFDTYQEWAYNGFTTTFHEWNREKPTDPEWNEGKTGNTCDMRKIGDGTSWFEKPHTYGYYVGEEDSIYYIDGVEIWRHPTWPTSLENPAYLLVNLAIGGSSGWPHDLSRYDGLADMYVDYIRIFAAE